MGKLLTWVVIGLAIWLAWRLWGLSQRRARQARDAARRADPASGAPDDGAAAGRGGPGRPGTPELMMQCAVCGVHLPGSEARFAGGKVFCSDAHRDQGTDGAAPVPPADARRDRR